MKLYGIFLSIRPMVIGFVIMMAVFGLLATQSEGASVEDLLKSMQMTPVEENKQAPDFELTSLEGVPVGLKEQKGKVVMLFFWASW